MGQHIIPPKSWKLYHMNEFHVPTRTVKVVISCNISALSIVSSPLLQNFVITVLEPPRLLKILADLIL